MFFPSVPVPMDLLTPICSRAVKGMIWFLGVALRNNCVNPIVGTFIESLQPTVILRREELRVTVGHVHDAVFVHTSYHRFSKDEGNVDFIASGWCEPISRATMIGSRRWLQSFQVVLFL